MREVREFLGFAVLGLALLAASPAPADGAVALGITGDVAKDGYSIGFGVDYPTEEKAREGALNHCRKHGGSPQTVAKCEIIAVFRRQCGAEAQDPKPGTPGFGWAIASDQETANNVALSNCRASAGRGRVDFCKIVNSTCDNTP